MPEMILQIKNKVGLHARPASLFVQEARRYASNIRITNGDTTVNGKSILNVLTLGADQGTTIVVNAEGDDADAALAGIRQLYDSNFGEQE